MVVDPGMAKGVNLWDIKVVIEYSGILLLLNVSPKCRQSKVSEVSVN